jgi:hypothetical protein
MSDPTKRAAGTTAASGDAAPGGYDLRRDAMSESVTSYPAPGQQCPVCEQVMPETPSEASTSVEDDFSLAQVVAQAADMYRWLERHLRFHGCEHEIREVAREYALAEFDALQGRTP